MRYKKEFEQMLDRWGEEAQIMIALEEMCELSKELHKYLRIKRNPETVEKEKRDAIMGNIQSEVADVLNCVKQLAVMFGYDQVYKIREEKVERTMKKIG